MKTKLLASITTIIFLLLLIAPISIQAKEDTLELNVPIGSLGTKDNPIKLGIGENPLGVYIRTWYGFIIGSVGIMATIMIMWGGFKWLTSRGNQSVIGEAKEIIWSALIGLFLAFLSYTILNLINPQLLNITMPAMNGLPGIISSNSGSDTPRQKKANALKILNSYLGINVDPEFSKMSTATIVGIANAANKLRVKETNFVIKHNLTIRRERYKRNDTYTNYVIIEDNSYLNAQNKAILSLFKTELKKQDFQVEVFGDSDDNDRIYLRVEGK